MASHTSSQVKGKPLSAATIRTGPDYIEVPFVATHESKRGRGFGRCVVEAVEDVARALNIPRLLLCRCAGLSGAAVLACGTCCFGVLCWAAADGGRQNRLPSSQGSLLQ